MNNITQIVGKGINEFGMSLALIHYMNNITHKLLWEIIDEIATCVNPLYEQYYTVMMKAQLIDNVYPQR